MWVSAFVFCLFSAGKVRRFSVGCVIVGWVGVQEKEVFNVTREKKGRERRILSNGDDGGDTEGEAVSQEKSSQESGSELSSRSVLGK